VRMIVASTPTPTKGARSKLLIVFTTGGDAVKLGLVASVGRRE
jgi:hypothetical protein